MGFLKLTFYFKSHSLSFRFGMTFAFFPGLDILCFLLHIYLLPTPSCLRSPYPASMVGIDGTPLPSSLWLDSTNGHLMVRVGLDREVRLLLHLALCLLGYNVSLYQVAQLWEGGSFLQLQMTPGSFGFRGGNGPLLLGRFTAPCWFPFIFPTDL